MLSRTLGRDSGRRRASRADDDFRTRWERTRYTLVAMGGSVVCSISRTVTAVAFWVAIAIPFVSLALLVGGLESRGELTAFVTLVTLNLVAFGVGHQHHQSETDRRDGRH